MLEGKTEYLHPLTDIINPNESFIYKFSEMGRHDYWCTLHPWMKGSIVVKDTTELNIPEWIKNNAVWWAEGQIDDDVFSTGIEFMIKEGIIVVPVTNNVEQSENTIIPEWIKNNAVWWAEGQIDDNSFATGIEFMIKEGIISH